MDFYNTYYSYLESELKENIDIKSFVIKEITPYHKLACTKETICLSEKDNETLIKRLPPSTLSKYERIKETKGYTYTYNNPYDNAEYYQSIDFVRLSDNVIKQLKGTPKEKILLNAYGLNNLKKKDSIFKKNTTTIPEDSFSLSLPKKCQYSIFKDKVKKVLNPVTIAISVNIPYEFYSQIYYLDNLLCYDIDKKDFWATNSYREEFEKQIFDIAINGINNPLMFKIEKGQIVSLQNSYGRFLAALVLQLPTIPVVLIHSPLQFDDVEKVIPQRNTVTMANELCAPYLIF